MRGARHPDAGTNERRVKIIAHRGVAKRAPQNTLPAAREAIAMGLDYVEVDLRTTADGLLIDLHADRVDGTTDGHGLVRDLRYAEIRALDAGSRFGPQFASTHVPLLGEVLALAKGRIGLYLDWKDADPEPVVSLLAAFDMTRDVLVHADEETSQGLRALNPEVPLMPGADGVADAHRLRAMLRPEAIEVRWRSFSEEAVRACHEAGMLCATSLAGGRGDRPEEMRRAIAAGVDLIETDEPEMLLAVLAEGGY